MKISNLLFAGIVAASASIAGFANAATDTIDATSGQTGTFFVPSLGQELDSPYYRGAGEDWGWTHNGIAAGFTSAELNISAYDVDEPAELDVIEAYDAGTSSWISLGSLTGANNAFSFTAFDIYNAAGGILQDDIVAGLEVRMLIDQNNGGWLVSLGKSVITTNGGNPGNPNPGTVPLPAGAWLMIAGIGGLAAMRRKKA
jgi:hypothetical protein